MDKVSGNVKGWFEWRFMAAGGGSGGRDELKCRVMWVLLMFFLQGFDDHSYFSQLSSMSERPKAMSAMLPVD